MSKFLCSVAGQVWDSSRCEPSLTGTRHPLAECWVVTCWVLRFQAKATVPIDAKILNKRNEQIKFCEGHKSQPTVISS